MAKSRAGKQGAKGGACAGKGGGYTVAMERPFQAGKRCVLKKWMILAGVAAMWGLGAQAGSFTNLNFEAYAGTGDELLPGWERSSIGYLWPLLDELPLASAGLGLGSTNTTAWAGQYSAFLSTGQTTEFIEGIGYIFNCCSAPEIWQTAQVPALATHIRYVASPTVIKDDTGMGWGYYEIRLQGWLGAVDLSAGVPEAMPDGSVRYVTDIRSLAGQEAMLKFSCAGGDNAMNPGSWHYLDQIEFLDVAGGVIGPNPTPICLEDFHAATLNTSLWEVAISGQTNAYSVLNQYLWTRVLPPAAPFETAYRYRAELRGDWDVRVDYRFSAPMGSSSNVGVLGTALAADFGTAGTSKASVGRLVDVDATDHRYAVDWGQGPTGDMPTTAVTGIFRLVRTGWEVAGYVWDAGSNDWRIVGTMDGYTDETARVGLKVWSTGAFSGKSAIIYSDNLLLANGRASLAGLAVKTFGLDGAGAPTVAWESAGMPTNTRVVVTRATSLVDSVWTLVSGAIGDTGGETNWTGSGGGTEPAYYRLEVVPGN